MCRDWIHMRTNLCVSRHACIHLFCLTLGRVHIHTNIHTYKYIHIRICTINNTCMRMRWLVYIHTHIYTYIYLYRHIQKRVCAYKIHNTYMRIYDTYLCTCISTYKCIHTCTHVSILCASASEMNAKKKTRIWMRTNTEQLKRHIRTVLHISV